MISLADMNMKEVAAGCSSSNDGGGDTNLSNNIHLPAAAFAASSSSSSTHSSASHSDSAMHSLLSIAAEKKGEGKGEMTAAVVGLAASSSFSSVPVDSSSIPLGLADPLSLSFIPTREATHISPTSRVDQDTIMQDAIPSATVDAPSSTTIDQLSEIEQLRRAINESKLHQQSLLLQINNLQSGVHQADGMIKKEQEVHSQQTPADTNVVTAAVLPSSLPDTNIVPLPSITSSTRIELVALATSRACNRVDTFVSSPITSRNLRVRTKKSKYAEVEEDEHEDEEGEEKVKEEPQGDDKDDDADYKGRDMDGEEFEDEDVSDFEAHVAASSRRASKSPNRRGCQKALSQSKTIVKATASKKSRTKTNASIDQKPAYIHYALVKYQYIVSREEAASLPLSQRNEGVAMPIRWLVTKKSNRRNGSGKAPSMYDLFVVAKDIATLIHKRRGSIAKAIATFDDRTEKGRVRVYGCRSPGKPGTQLLTVLTMRGVERLMRKSKYSRAIEVWKWTKRMALELCQSIGNVEQNLQPVASSRWLNEGGKTKPNDISPVQRLKWLKHDETAQARLEPEDVEVMKLDRFHARFVESPELVLKQTQDEDENGEEEEDEDEDEDADFRLKEEDIEPSPEPIAGGVSAVASFTDDLVATRPNSTPPIHQPVQPRSTPPPPATNFRHQANAKKKKTKGGMPNTEASTDVTPMSSIASTPSHQREVDHSAARQFAAQDLAVKIASKEHSKMKATHAHKSGKRTKPSTSRSGEMMAATPKHGEMTSPLRKRVKKEPIKKEKSDEEEAYDEPVLAEAIPPHEYYSTLQTAAFNHPMQSPIAGLSSRFSTPISTPRLTPKSNISSSSYGSTPPFSGSVFAPLSLTSLLHSREPTPNSSRIGSPVPMMMGIMRPSKHLRVNSNTEMIDIGSIHQAGSEANSPNHVYRSMQQVQPPPPRPTLASSSTNQQTQNQYQRGYSYSSPHQSPSQSSSMLYQNMIYSPSQQQQQLSRFHHAQPIQTAPIAAAAAAAATGGGMFTNSSLSSYHSNISPRQLQYPPITHPKQHQYQQQCQPQQHQQHQSYQQQNQYHYSQQQQHQ